MEKISFEKWLFENSQDFEPLGDILKTLALYSEFLPNFEDFIVWLLNHQTGFYHTNFYEAVKEDYHFDFINGITDKIKDYSDFEKAVIIKTLLTFLNDDLKIIKWYVEEATKERQTEFKYYSQEDYDEYVSKEYVFEYVILHFDLLFKKLNNNLPFLIKDKSKSLINLDDPYPKVGWTIEKNPNYKEITQTPLPDEIEPITLPENIKTTKVNSIRLLHYTGILDFLLKKYPRMNESNLASFFELITKTPIIHRNQNTHFYKNNDDSMHHKDNLDLILSKFNMIAENPKK